jgi:hypothetical protein
VFQIVERKRGAEMTAGTRSGSGRPVAGRRAMAAGREVVSVREHRQRLEGMLRTSIGFRVDCPEGRVGVLTAVLPEYDDLPPDRVEIASGFFIVTAVTVPFRDVASVDVIRRRVIIRTVPERRRGTRLEMARRVHQFLHAGGHGPARMTTWAQEVPR